jgi:hypothetical protein
MHICNRNNRWEETDARGIFLCFVCEICVEEKLGRYRPEVMTDPNYWTSEYINDE